MSTQQAGSERTNLQSGNLAEVLTTASASRAAVLHPLPPPLLPLSLPLSFVGQPEGLPAAIWRLVCFMQFGLSFNISCMLATFC